MENRRDVASRGKQVFHMLSRQLIKIGLTPNQISIASSLFAFLGGYGFYLISQGDVSVYTGVVVCLLGIQLRLICNLIDGLMAVEGGMSSPQGEIYNDVPDRFSDVFLIVATGFVIAPIAPLGWTISWSAAVLAVMTAYIRVLGASMNVGHDFGGPMAKQHRMAILSLGVISLAVENYLQLPLGRVLLAATVVIAVGSLLTVFLRLKRISKKLT